MPRRYHTLELTERQWQAQIVELAKVMGWACYHTYDSRRSDPGFPDLVMAKEGRIIFAEVKTAKGQITPGQDFWLRHLGGFNLVGPTEGVQVFVWRPDDWPEVERVLKGESGVEIVVEELKA